MTALATQMMKDGSLWWLGPLVLMIVVYVPPLVIVAVLKHGDRKQQP